jgi:hypothetical protein
LIFLFVIGSKVLEVEYAWSSEQASNNKRASKAGGLQRQLKQAAENQNRTPLPKKQTWTNTELVIGAAQDLRKKLGRKWQALGCMIG